MACECWRAGCYWFSFSDVLGSLLCRHQPVQEVPHLHSSCRYDLQGQEENRGAAPCVRHLRRCLYAHAYGWVEITILSFISASHSSPESFEPYELFICSIARQMKFDLERLSSTHFRPTKASSLWLVKQISLTEMLIWPRFSSQQKVGLQFA